MTDQEKCDRMKAQTAFDRALTVGQPVLARWTNNHSYYAIPGTVSKVNGCSVRVALTEEYGGWPIGHEVIVPRLTGGRYGFNNL